MGLPFVGDAVPYVPPAPAGRGFRKSEIFGGPSRRPAPTGFIQHRAGSPIRLRFRKVLPRNGTMAVPYVLYPKYAKESPVSGETGDLFVFSTKNVRPYTPSGNRQVSTMSDHTCLTRLSTSTMLDSLAPGTAGRPVGRFLLALRLAESIRHEFSAVNHRWTRPEPSPPASFSTSATETWL